MLFMPIRLIKVLSISSRCIILTLLRRARSAKPRYRKMVFEFLINSSQMRKEFYAHDLVSLDRQISDEVDPFLLDTEIARLKGIVALFSRCPGSTVVRFLRIDPSVSGSNPHSAKLGVGNSPAPRNSMRRNHEVTSNREEEPGHCSISKKFLSVQISTNEQRFLSI